MTTDRTVTVRPAQQVGQMRHRRPAMKPLTLYWSSEKGITKPLIVKKSATPKGPSQPSGTSEGNTGGV